MIEPLTRFALDVDDWTTTLEGPDALDEALEAVRQCRRELAVVESQLEARLALSWPCPGKRAVINGWEVERDYTPPSWRWDRAAVLTELKAQADDRGVDALALVVETAGIGYFKVTKLRALGIEPDLYREPSGEHRWKVRRLNKAEEGES